MKILHILNTSSYSGAENVAITIIKELEKDKNYKAYYVCPRGNIEKKLVEEGIKYIPIKRLCKKELKRVIKEYRPDVIHAHDFRASVICSRLKSQVIISHIHKNDPKMKSINMYSIIYLLSTFRYKRILVVSEIIKNEFIFKKILKEKMIVVSNPININEIKRKAEEGCFNEKSDLIYVGRLSKEKNPIEYIEIVKKIKELIPNIRCFMIGDGEQKDLCIKKIKQYNLENTIKMYGFVENPYVILKNAKIACTTSKWEGFGLAVIEALALGVPVVVENVGNLSEIVNDQCGYVVNGEEEFVKKVLELIKCKNLRTEKSKNARIRANQLQNIDEYMKLIKNVYEQ